MNLTSKDTDLKMETGRCYCAKFT